MAGQIGEFISDEKISEWTDIEELAKWFGESSDDHFVEGKKYSIYNNSASSFRFICTADLDESAFGSYANQGSLIYFKPNSTEKIYIKGNNFNLAISEVE